ncbi:MAG: hypothetical protein H6718_20415 [Polyangiaceae bacterium]|nr:hypothetical protein [Myxococcales bacterium]MCB9587779.1 hypothetical protein [Polyangiaceae bacterium]MCB9608728.1 hypothetical protein [Polyangiaceae bacterium]
MSLLAVGCGSSDSSGLLGGGSGAQGGAAGSAGTAGTGGTTSAGGSGGQSSGGSAGNTTGGSAGAAGAPCDLSGSWGSYLEIDVAWTNTMVLQAGNDKIRVWLLGNRVQEAAGAYETVNTCGITLPDFQSNFLGGNERFGVWFPGDVFDLGGIPIFRIDFSGAFEIGGSVESAPVALLVGHTMIDPLNDAWPALTQVKASDPDADTKPGLTGFASKGNGYFHPPTDALKFERAQALWIVSRTVAKLSAKVDSCDALTGSAEVPMIAGKPGLQSHIIGCIKDNGDQCNAQQTEFLDTNRPDFQPANTSRFVSQRVPAGTTCAEVRGLFQ